MKTTSIFSLLAILLFAIGCNTTKQVADQVVKNGNIHTVDEKNPNAEAIAIKDGKIIFVGSNKEVEKYIGKKTQVSDLEGQTVIPSFIDSHTHPGLVAITSSNKELEKYVLPTTSIEDTYAYLRKIAKENPDIPFLMLGRWANPLFGVKGPDRKILDEIFPNTAVVLADSSGHSYWLNTAAFKAFGIDENTPDLKEGLSFFVKDENGRKTGWVKEFVLFPYLDMFSKVDPNQIKGSIGEYLNYLAKKGVSTVLDAGTFGAEESVYKAVHQLEKEGKLPVRYEGTHHLFIPNQLDSAVSVLLDLKKKYDGDLLKINTIKIHFDGVNEINTAAVLEDFSNEPGNKGGILFEEDELKGLLLELAKHKLNLHLHSVGDRSIRTALNAMEKAQKEYGGKLPVQLTLSHLEVVNPADMKRFKELGVHANFTPHWFGGTTFIGSHEALGEERYAHNQPAGALIKAGANVTFSSDVVAKPTEYRANPFLGVQMGVTRQDPILGQGKPTFGQESDKATVEQMIKGYTINNAKQLGLENEIGSLEIGKSADFVVLPSDIFTMDVKQIYKLEPKAVYYKGKKQN